MALSYDSYDIAQLESQAGIIKKINQIQLSYHQGPQQHRGKNDGFVSPLGLNIIIAATIIRLCRIINISILLNQLNSFNDKKFSRISFFP
jgi:hypothetical protein